MLDWEARHKWVNSLCVLFLGNPDIVDIVHSTGQNTGSRLYPGIINNQHVNKKQNQKTRKTRLKLNKAKISIRLCNPEVRLLGRYNQLIEVRHRTGAETGLKPKQKSWYKHGLNSKQNNIHAGKFATRWEREFRTIIIVFPYNHPQKASMRQKNRQICQVRVD